MITFMFLQVDLGMRLSLQLHDDGPIALACGAAPPYRPAGRIVGIEQRMET
jgi:hypothetical protein